jgi:hypothetical protein
MNEWQGKPKYWEETCPSAAMCTPDPTRLEPGSNPGRRGAKPATNRLTYGMAFIYVTEGLCKASNRP